MRKTLKLAWREYRTAVRSKAFVIMIVLMPVMMGGSLIVMKLVEDRVDTAEKRIAVLDHTGVLGPALAAAADARNAAEIYAPQTGQQIQPAYRIELVTPDPADPDRQRLALSDRVRNRALHAFVEIDAGLVQDAGPGTIAYHAENAVIDDIRDWVAQAANGKLRSWRAAAAGLDEPTVSRLLQWQPVEPMGLLSVDESGGVAQAERSDEGRVMLVPAIMLMLMFMMIAVGATPLLNSVLEEKMQRIAEVLLGSVRPFQLMMGKLLGSIGVSLTVMLVYLAGGIYIAQRAAVSDYIPYDLLPWFAVYLTGAILMFGALFIALGAACNDLKEAQSLMMPVWVLVMIPMFVWMPVLREPTGTLATTMSLIPTCTPMLMLIRQASPATIPAWQPWAGLVGMLVFTVACVWIAGRIFRVGILMQGQSPKLATLARWALRG